MRKTFRSIKKYNLENFIGVLWSKISFKIEMSSCFPGENKTLTITPQVFEF